MSLALADLVCLPHLRWSHVLDGARREPVLAALPDGMVSAVTGRASSRR